MLVIAAVLLLLAAPVSGLVNFAADTTSGEAPLTVQFTDLSAVPTPATYAWDVDGDETADLFDRNPSWTYALPGTYNVALTVTDATGYPDQLWQFDYITVHPPTCDAVLITVGSGLTDAEGTILGVLSRQGYSIATLPAVYATRDALAQFPVVIIAGYTQFLSSGLVSEAIADGTDVVLLGDAALI
ncbi:MAG: PKD domain-containing protein, partial [Methanomicrobiales archaeon]|nr:PKD domain-containing protein [Methanomicrobiales archaeon]